MDCFTVTDIKCNHIYFYHLSQQRYLSTMMTTTNEAPTLWQNLSIQWLWYWRRSAATASHCDVIKGKLNQSLNAPQSLRILIASRSAPSVNTNESNGYCSVSSARRSVHQHHHYHQHQHLHQPKQTAVTSPYAQAHDQFGGRTAKRIPCLYT